MHRLKGSDCQAVIACQILVAGSATPSNMLNLHRASKVLSRNSRLEKSRSGVEPHHASPSKCPALVFAKLGVLSNFATYHTLTLVPGKLLPYSVLPLASQCSVHTSLHTAQRFASANSTELPAPVVTYPVVSRAYVIFSYFGLGLVDALASGNGGRSRNWTEV